MMEVPTANAELGAPARKRRIVDEVAGVLLLSAAIALLLSLLTYNPIDPSWNVVGPQQQPSNAIGPVGAHVSDVLLQTLGIVALGVPVVLLILSWYRLRGRSVQALPVQIAIWGILVIALAALAGLLFPANAYVWQNIRPGGFVGLLVAQGLAALLNTVGAALFLVTVLILSLIVAVNFSFVELVDRVKGGAAWLVAKGKAVGASRPATSTEPEEETSPGSVAVRLKKKSRTPLLDLTPEGTESPVDAATPLAEPEPSGTPSVAAPVVGEVKLIPDLPVDEAARQAATMAALPRSDEQGPRDEVTEMLSTATVKQIRPEEKAAPAKRPAQPAHAEFTLPSTELLNEPQPIHESIEIQQDELMQLAHQLAERCKEFAVTGHVHQISPGPVVTTFEFKADPGVKYSRITSLVDDLCLALAAESIRIDRIPGKSTVGIEVPNKRREIISIRELIESRKFQTARSKLTVALGKTIDGSIYVTELGKMPHLLIAGATGTGKSVTVNAIIVSLLYKGTPEDIRFILIDPKRLELGLYHDIPHLLTPIVTDPKRASYALKWAVTEMEDRYRLLAGFGVRNIEQFNREVRENRGRDFMGQEPLMREIKPLPYLVIIVDELADLMMTASSDVETSITRLAQMARAVGIHLVLTTQRPSVDIITGLIKANFPCRIAFRVSSKVDSRTIIDGNGAEQLLGKGDMLFLPPGTSRLVRVHGAYVDEKEINRIVEVLKKQGAPEYDETVLMSEKEAEAAESGLAQRDELFDEALRIVIRMGRASTSVLQRRLRIGYGRAASILDMMEHEGFIEPPNGMRPRAVTQKAREFAERLEELAEEEE
jgi:S-DNA-T family DNA segregation ATPase FtsK/SpoIIIE